MDTRNNDREVLDRVRRIETRVVQLADFIGVDVRGQDCVRVVRRSPAVAVVRSMDVSVSRIVNQLRDLGITDGDVDIMVQGDTRTFLQLRLDYLK